MGPIECMVRGLSEKHGFRRLEHYRNPQNTRSRSLERKDKLRNSSLIQRDSLHTLVGRGRGSKGIGEGRDA